MRYISSIRKKFKNIHLSPRLVLSLPRLAVILLALVVLGGILSVHYNNSHSSKAVTTSTSSAEQPLATTPTGATTPNTATLPSATPQASKTNPSTSTPPAQGGFYPPAPTTSPLTGISIRNVTNAYPYFNTGTAGVYFSLSANTYNVQQPANGYILFWAIEGFNNHADYPAADPYDYSKTFTVPQGQSEGNVAMPTYRGTYTYYVKICVNQGGVCGVTSNEFTTTLSDYSS